AERQQLFSSNEELLSEIILDKEYDVNVTLLVDGKPLVGNAVATFSGERSASVAWPGNLDIKLSEGSYNVSVYVYSNTSIPIPADSKTQCQEVVASGILGLFGGTKEQCYEINSPATKIESAIIGGGKADAYLLPVDLERGNIILRVDSLPVPKTLNELQENYLKFDNLGVEVG
ncbi:MAG: hypothetical protein WCK90_03135, partial [archaeon]